MFFSNLKLHMLFEREPKKESNYIAILQLVIFYLQRYCVLEKRFWSSIYLSLCNITLFVTSFQRKGLVGLGLKEADDASGENMEGDDVAHGFKVSPVDPPLFCVGVPVTPPNISEKSIIELLISDKNLNLSRRKNRESCAFRSPFDLTNFLEKISNLQILPKIR